MESFVKNQLQKDEHIDLNVKKSPIALIIIWISIPGFYLVQFLLLYLPKILKILISKSFKNAIKKELNLDTLTYKSIKEYIRNDIFSNINIPSFLVKFIFFLISLLIICWLCWCIYMTIKFLHSNLIITNKRVFGKVGNKTLICNHNDIKNVFIEQTLIGRIFNYGSIIIYSKGQSLKFKNITNPNKLKDDLLNLNKEPYII